MVRGRGENGCSEKHVQRALINYFRFTNLQIGPLFRV